MKHGSTNLIQHNLQKAAQGLKSALRFDGNKPGRLTTFAPRSELAPSLSCSTTPRVPCRNSQTDSGVFTLAAATGRIMEGEHGKTRHSVGNTRKRSQNRNECLAAGSSNARKSADVLILHKSSVAVSDLSRPLQTGVAKNFLRTFSRSSQSATAATARKQLAQHQTKSPMGNSRSVKYLTAGTSSPRDEMTSKPVSMLRYLKEKFIKQKLRSFLCYKDFYSFMLISRQIFSKAYLHKLQIGIVARGIGKSLRRRLWQCKCKITAIKAREKHPYEYYCCLPCPDDHDIDKDINRTFCVTHQFCSDPDNYKKLRRLLHAFATKNPEIGYIQGLNFIVGNLVLLFPEEFAFWCLESLCGNYKVYGLLSKGMPQLKLRLYQLERLMQIYVPDVYATLLSKEVPCEVFSIQWYVTLFSHDFDPALLALVWDLFLIHKWRFMFQLSISILRQMAAKVEELEYDELVVYMRTALERDQVDKARAVKEALEIKVPKEMLKLLKAEYELRRSDTIVPPPQEDQPIRVNATKVACPFKVHAGRTVAPFRSVTARNSGGRLGSKTVTGTNTGDTTETSTSTQQCPQPKKLRLSKSPPELMRRRGSEVPHPQPRTAPQFKLMPLGRAQIPVSATGKTDLVRKSYVAQAAGDVGSPAGAAGMKAAQREDKGTDVVSPSDERNRSRCPRTFEPPRFHPRNDLPAYATVSTGMISRVMMTNASASNNVNMAMLKTIRRAIQQHMGHDGKGKSRGKDEGSKKRTKQVLPI